MPSPIKGQTPSTPYKKLGRRWSKGYHTGIDYAVPVGTDVHAVADGQIVADTWGQAYGTQIVQKLDGGWFIYGHLSSKLVKPDDNVKAGQVIAKSGNSGNSTGAHLHVELRNNPHWSSGKDLDPSNLVATKKATVVKKLKTKVIAPVIRKK